MGQRGQRGSVRVEGPSWVGYWNTYQYNPETGRNVRKQRSVRVGPKSLSKFQAYKELAKHIEKSAQGTSQAGLVDCKMTFKSFTESRWLPTKEAKWRSHTNARGKTINPGKAAALHTLNKIFKAFGGVTLDHIDPTALQVWLNDLAKTHSESLVKHARYYLKSILEWAVWEECLHRNPAKFLQLPDTKSVAKSVLTPKQFNSVLKELDTQHSLLVRVAVFCAFRPSELLALRWRDFDPKNKVFVIRETVYRGVLRPYTKTTDENEENRKLLTVAIPDALVKELEEYRSPKNLCGHGWCRQQEDHPVHKARQRGGHPFSPGIRLGTEDSFIFSTPEGTPLHKENILHRTFLPVKKKVKLPALNFQVLRRTIATIAQQEGSLKDIQVHLRHRSPNVTAHEYVQEIPESARSMVNAVFESLSTQQKD